MSGASAPPPRHPRPDREQLTPVKATDIALVLAGVILIAGNWAPATPAA